MAIKYTMVREDPGNFRVYFRKVGNGSLYCFQNDGSWGNDRVTFNLCSRDGEPECEATMPVKADVDVWLMPLSLKGYGARCKVEPHAA